MKNINFSLVLFICLLLLSFSVCAQNSVDVAMGGIKIINNGANDQNTDDSNNSTDPTNEKPKCTVDEQIKNCTKQKQREDDFLRNRPDIAMINCHEEQIDAVLKKDKSFSEKYCPLPNYKLNSENDTETKQFSAPNNAGFSSGRRKIN